jgi:hypothetical protein
MNTIQAKDLKVNDVIRRGRKTFVVTFTQLSETGTSVVLGLMNQANGEFPVPERFGATVDFKTA